MAPEHAPERKSDPVMPIQGGRLMPSDPLHPAAASREDTVRRIAYELYQRRGAQDGRDQQDWFAAESKYRDTFGL
jgi:Protein of unknown function (DUF2934)